MTKQNFEKTLSYAQAQDEADPLRKFRERFYFPQNADEMYLTYPSLRISWQQYLNANQSNIIRATNNNRGQWNVAAYNFITMQ